MAVPVVVSPATAGGAVALVRVAQACGRRNLLERPIPRVAEELAATIAGYVQVLVAVVVVVGSAAPISSSLPVVDPRERCHVVKRAVAVVAKEGVRSHRVHGVQVLESIAVEVKDKGAATHVHDLVVAKTPMDENDPRLPRGVDEDLVVLAHIVRLREVRALWSKRRRRR